ncbi:hypothetical protein PVAND_011054 [Polypedilum vanderplanki]|uniref:WD repeat-containing protein 63 n=1 Tax=Polypedilum vanderplanki TaxID=319348 RepID=A0A9J6CIE8_POLVA|nr:hypothetical protein PVAND_011054 [Polypedilum vanderplanki]
MNKGKVLTNTPAPSTPAPQIDQNDNALTESDKECSDEEDFELLIGFHPEYAKTRLFSMPNSITLSIDVEQQRELFIEVGVNLSTENPWKQISKQFLDDHLSTDTYDMQVLKEKLNEIDNDSMLLIGYVPHLSDEKNDSFIIFLDEATCKEASEVIKRLEACERRKIKKSIIKHPRPYKSMGSETTVDSYVSVKRTNVVDVELQSVYPMRYTNAKFEHRYADDIRDGYAELLPDKRIAFDNVYRKMIDRAIQSGAHKITEEQQTDPTFPTNAWSQYLYELEEHEVKDVETETVASIEEKKEDDMPLMLTRRKKSKEEAPVVEVKQEFEPTVSKQVEDLLQILEFNRIDMYRDDYKFIGNEEVPKYQTPYLEEICCFANVSKCKGKHVVSMDWHPELSGICVVAYGFNFRSKNIHDEENFDAVKQTIIESNSILIWSFDDPLYPKLELDSIREISCLSFCPYDPNIIVGGTINGQLVIWDISNRLEKVNSNSDAMLSPEQQKHRNEIRDYLKWSKIDDSNKIVAPALLSAIDRSHENSVVSIKWLARNYQCTSRGVLKEDRQKGTLYRQFATTSLDGKIFFWDLDWSPSEEGGTKLVVQESKVQFPDELKDEMSPLKAFDKIFTPHYSLTFTRPITSFTFNEGEFHYEPITKLTKFNLSTCVRYKIISIRKESFNPKMVLGSSAGELLSCSWDGHDFSQGATLDPKIMIHESFANIHDGSITHVERNEFMNEAFISIGGRIFALWHDEYRERPIFWRRCKTLLTGVQWSKDRPSVFFLIYENGSLEIWDLTSRIDKPSLSESLGGNILTYISQHKLPLARRVLAIADFNSNLRIFMVPYAFVSPKDNEKENFIQFINDEVQRKRDQDQWKEVWYQTNKDIVDAKKDVEQQIMDEQERKERQKKEIEEKRAQLAEAEAKKLAKRNAKKSKHDLHERMEKKWNDQNYKRLLKIMMERKKVDRDLIEKQTKILKDRMRYSEEKKLAIKQNLAKIEEDISSVRSRLIPIEEYQATREELVSETIDLMLSKTLDYQEIENNALKEMEIQPEMDYMKISEILKRCKLNRDILNQSMGMQPKFAKFRQDRHSKMSRYSSMSQLGGVRTSEIHLSAEPKEDF